MSAELFREDVRTGRHPLAEFDEGRPGSLHCEDKPRVPTVEVEDALAIISHDNAQRKSRCTWGEDQSKLDTAPTLLSHRLTFPRLWMTRCRVVSTKLIVHSRHTIQCD